MASGAFRRLKSPYVSWRSRIEGKTLPSVSLPERLRGGRVEKMLDYCKTVAGDYVESVHQLRDGIREKPWRSVAGLGAGSALWYACRTNPGGERDFRARFVEVNQDVMSVSDQVRNPLSESHQLSLSRWLTEGTLRAMNLGLCTVIWRDNAGADGALYENQCEYLQVGYLDRLRSRLVDVGFLGKWWFTEAAMKDYDVNPTEWDEQGSPKAPQSQLKQMW